MFACIIGNGWNVYFIGLKGIQRWWNGASRHRIGAWSWKCKYFIFLLFWGFLHHSPNDMNTLTHYKYFVFCFLGTRILAGEKCDTARLQGCNIRIRTHLKCCFCLYILTVSLPKSPLCALVLESAVCICLDKLIFYVWESFFARTFCVLMTYLRCVSLWLQQTLW